MKNALKSIVVLALLVGQAMSVMAAPTTIKKNKISSYIKEVTVFSDRALVVRQATVNLVPGERTIKFSKLTGSLDPNTVQIKGRGNALIKGVKVSKVYLMS